MLILNPLQTALSALITGVAVKLISRYVNNIDESPLPSPSTTQIWKTRFTDNPETLQFPRCPLNEHAQAKLDRALDAIFVSHGIEAEKEGEEQIASSPSETTTTIQPPPPNILELNRDNYHLLFSGDWLILSHFPGLFTSDKFLKIFQEQYCTMAPTTLKCAVLNVNGEELIVAGLQIKNYPSLRLVTEGGRLREWPFRIFYGISQEIVSFAAHQHWTLLPVYQKLPNLDESDWFLSFTAFQIKTFNFCLGFLNAIQMRVVDWIIDHRPITASLLVVISLGGSIFLLK